MSDMFGVLNAEFEAFKGASGVRDAERLAVEVQSAAFVLEQINLSAYITPMSAKLPRMIDAARAFYALCDDKEKLEKLSAMEAEVKEVGGRNGGLRSQLEELDLAVMELAERLRRLEFALGQATKPASVPPAVPVPEAPAPKPERKQKPSSPPRPSEVTTPPAPNSIEALKAEIEIYHKVGTSVPWSEVVEGVSNKLELIKRLHQMGSAHMQIVHPVIGPTGCAGLLLLLTLADVTNNGKSTSHKFCPVRQAAEVTADYLPGQKSALVKRFCSSFRQAAEILLRNDRCPFKIQKFEGASAPPHVKKYGAKTAYYVTGDIYQSLQLPWLK